MSHDKGPHGGECRAEPSRMLSSKYHNIPTQTITSSTHSTAQNGKEKFNTKGTPSKHTTTFNQHTRDSTEDPNTAKQSQQGGPQRSYTGTARITTTQLSRHSKENPNAAKQSQHREPPSRVHEVQQQTAAQPMARHTYPSTTKQTPSQAKHPCVHKALWQATTETRTQHTCTTTN